MTSWQPYPDGTPDPNASNPPPAGYASASPGTGPYGSYGPPVTGGNPPPYVQTGPGPAFAAGPYAGPVQYVVHQNQSNGTGTAGFVCGLIGLVFCWVPWFGIILAIIGMALSATGLSHASRTGAPKGLATAGLVCSIIAMIPALILLVIFLTAVSYL